MENKGRKQYIDVARGGVILLVVIGHLVPFNKLIWLWIFAFHMPFFFIMSGYCSSEKNFKVSFGKYFIKYAKALLVPAIMIRIIYQFVGVSGVDFSSEAWMRDSIMNFIHPLSEWFIMALFLSKMLFYWVHRILNLVDNEKVQRIICFFIVGVSFYLGETWNNIGLHGKPYWFPMPIDCSLIALSFVLIGYWCKKINVAELYDQYKILAIPAGTLSVLSILWLIRFQSYTNVCDIYFGNSSISYYVFASVLSFYCLMICRWLSEKIKVNNIILNVLGLLGRNTIIVYPGHTIIFYLLNQLIYKKTGVLYIPMHNFKTSLIFVYFIISVIILILICLLKEKFWKKQIKISNNFLGFTLFFSILMFSIFPCSYANASEINRGDENVYEINSLQDFLDFRDNVNLGNDYAECYVVQNVDINLSEIDNFEPIGIFDSGYYFYGTYDGKGHSISGLNMTREDNCALFPVLGGTVCNLRIASGNISGACVGAFASHATSEGKALIINCINYANLYGSVRAGGIADNFNGRIINCINKGKIEAYSGEIGDIVSYSALDIQNTYCDGEQLYPDQFTFNNNHVIGDETENMLRDFNLRLGEETVREKIELNDVTVKNDMYDFSEEHGMMYGLGIVLYYLHSYWIDAILIIMIVIASMKTRKAYIQFRTENRS